jgi:hypothetical protein
MCVMIRITSAASARETNNSSIDNMIGFSCDKEDMCDQQFMFDYLGWLFNVEYNSLASTIRPLLTIGQQGKQNILKIYFQ